MDRARRFESRSVSPSSSKTFMSTGDSKLSLGVNVTLHVWLLLYDFGSQKSGLLVVLHLCLGCDLSSTNTRAMSSTPCHSDYANNLWVHDNICTRLYACVVFVLDSTLIMITSLFFLLSPFTMFWQFLFFFLQGRISPQSVTEDPVQVVHGERLLKQAE